MLKECTSVIDNNRNVELESLAEGKWSGYFNVASHKHWLFHAQTILWHAVMETNAQKLSDFYL